MKQKGTQTSVGSKIRSRAGITAKILYGAAAFLTLLALQAGAQEKSFLWKVQSKQNTVFLLGSIHALKKENYPLKPAIEQSYEKSKRVIFEVDLGSAAPDKVQGMILQKGV